MKIRFQKLVNAVAVAICLWTAPQSRAGLALNLGLFQFKDAFGHSYSISPFLSVDNTVPNLPFGDYEIASPLAANVMDYEFTESGFQLTGSDGTTYLSFEELINAVTNGVWSIYQTTSTTTNVYHFTVSAPTLTSNAFPEVNILFPTNGAAIATNLPTIQWEGPANYSTLVVSAHSDDYSAYYLVYPPPTDTSWTPPGVLPLGINDSQVEYFTDASAIITATVPLDGSSNAIAAWSSSGSLQTTGDSQFTVLPPPPSVHTNIAHFRFDKVNSLNSLSALIYDSSPYGNDFNGEEFFGSPGAQEDTNAAAGPGAARFFGNSSLVFMSGNQAFTNIQSVLSRTFTLSLWLNTTDTFGVVLYSFDTIAGINSLIVSVDGARAKFFTTDGLGAFTLSQSSANVNDGSYHHIVITRDQETGEQKLYVDGVLNDTEIGTTNDLDGDGQTISLGGVDSAGFNGVIDDVQLYAGALTPTEVAQLHANPGTILPDSFPEANDFSASIVLNVSRTSVPGEDDVFSAAPDFSSFSPTTTFDVVESPNGLCYGTTLSGPNLANLTFDQLMNELTNGTWTITFDKGAPSQRRFEFNVSITPSGTNFLGPVYILSPANGSASLNLSPRVQWTGPDGFDSVTLDTEGPSSWMFSYSGATTDVLLPPLLPGQYIVPVTYLKFSTPNLTLSTPVNANGITVSDWTTEVDLQSGNQVSFELDTPTVHTNIAHLRFDKASFLGFDSSQYGNDFPHGQFFGGPIRETEMVIAGPGAARFLGNTYLFSLYGEAAFTQMQSALSRTFTLSMWVNTTNSFGSDSDEARYGVALLDDYNYNLDLYGGTNSLIPLALTGQKAAFSTIDETGAATTLHSVTNVIDGNYHHIVVSRDQTTGEMRLYVDGVLQGTEIGTTNVLDGNTSLLSLGSSELGLEFIGLIDDMQLYAGALAPAEVEQLYLEPGAILRDSFPETNNFSVSLTLTLSRDSSDYNFIAAPAPASITPAIAESPNRIFYGRTTGVTGGTLLDFADFMNELTNGEWTITFNPGTPDQRRFAFALSISPPGADILPPVTILSPTNGSTILNPTPDFQWTGLAGFSYIDLVAAEIPYSDRTLPATATNGTPYAVFPPGGYNVFVTYYGNAPNVTLSAPANENGFAVANWTEQVSTISQGQVSFTVAEPPLPVQLLNPQRVGGNFQFGFLSQNGKTNIIQSRTNLTLGTWIDRTNVVGDGTSQIILLPLNSGARSEFFRIITQ
jgi:hypothetical protein